MSILGLTIDYGPYGWLDRYDPHHVCNGSDDSGRYDFAAQPEVGRCGDGSSSAWLASPNRPDMLRIGPHQVNSPWLLPRHASQICRWNCEVGDMGVLGL